VSFQDRPYYRQQQPGGFGHGGLPSFGLPRPTQMIKYLLIANVVVFFLQLIFRGRLELAFAATGARPWQLWRLVTFQFLHAGPIHLLFNMIGLYFLGRILEQSWGPKKFLVFYLTCGVVGGALYVLANALGWLGGVLLLGASGGVLGLLAACAVLFPQITVILILFPMPIRTAAFLLTALYFLMVVSSGDNAGGDLCHLGGMATGFLWVTGRPYLQAWRMKKREGTYQRQVAQREQLQYEVDRILAKVHDQGIRSLTRREKQILQRATEEKKGTTRVK